MHVARVVVGVANVDPKANVEALSVKTLCKVLIASSLIVILPLPVVAQHVPFFAPSPPPGVRYLHARGTLLGWGNGNGMTSFMIKTHSGTTLRFIAAREITFDGSVVNCYTAPIGSAKPGPGCVGWPAGIVVGATNVTVTYFALASFPSYGGAATTVVSDGNRRSGKRTRSR